MRSITIAGKTIDDQSEAWTIAELGHNHGGSLAVCKGMIRAAAEAGADAVKLQKRDNRSLYTRAAYDRPYVSENSFGATYGEHREALELNWQEHGMAADYASDHGVTCFATPFDEVSAFDLDSLGVPCFKIASGDLTNTPLLRYVAELEKPIIISTGAADQADVDRAVNAVYPINQQLSVLHCTAVYPSPAEVLNLRVISTYRERYPELVIGLSSHYNGIADVVAGYVLGARIFEKHFTLDRTSKGTDHAFSLEPAGFKKMVSYLRATRQMLGSGVKVIQDGERAALEKMGKSLVAARDLPAGHVLTADDIAIKSPGGGVPPYLIDEVIGGVLAADKAADTPFIGPVWAQTQEEALERFALLGYVSDAIR